MSVYEVIKGYVPSDVTPENGTKMGWLRIGPQQDGDPSARLDLDAGRNLSLEVEVLASSQVNGPCFIPSKGRFEQAIQFSGTIVLDNEACTASADGVLFPSGSEPGKVYIDFVPVAENRTE